MKLLFVLVLAAVLAKDKHSFQQGDDVPFFVNKIGPYNNPTEFYPYYSLPFCQPHEIDHKHNNLGQNIIGDEAVTALYDIHFGLEEHDAVLCEQTYTEEELDQFRSAIENFYYFEWLIDDLPIFGFIGTQEGSATRHLLYTHSHFTIAKNQDHIIQVTLSTDATRTVDLSQPVKKIKFTYSVSWKDTDIPFRRRMQLYNNNFFKQEMEIHWLSIMNSIVLVLLLTGFLSIIILRVLKNDYARYALDEEQDTEEFGWKLIHGDVFRIPSNFGLLSSFLGLGAQFLVIVFGVLFLALSGLFHPQMRGNLYVAIIVLYALTSFVSGAVSARFYRQFGGEAWAWNIVQTATLFTGPLTLVVSVVNTIAIAYRVMIALPFTTILEVLAILLLVGFPLTLLGGIIGRRTAGDFEAPCRTKKVPREVPAIPWYRQLPVQMAMAGFLPFSAIYIEMFYIFSSIWGHSTYQLFGVIFIVFLILLIVCACITIALTYFQLSLEDHRWWWPAFLSGGSTGIFIFLYSVFFFSYRSRMFGLLQTSFYFGYMLVISYFFFVMLGTVGFVSSLTFIKNIYKQIKTD